MISLALVGKDISHSKSPQIYRELIGQEIKYKIFDCPSEKDIPSLDKIFEKYQGLSVTSPYKKFFLNQVSVLPGFENLGAINAIRKSGKIFEAINTDYLAIGKIIQGFKVKKVILLGDGVMASITQKILDKAGVDRNTKVSEWNDDQLGKIRQLINDEFKVEGALRSETQLNIKRLMDIGSYRGIRHRSGLPLRGQHTKNNSRTRKGKRKTVANKKKVTK